MLRIILPLTVLVCAAAAATAAPPPEVAAVLDRFVAAVGGREAVAAANVLHHRGRVVQDLSWHEPTHEETPFRAEARADGRVRYAATDRWDGLPARDDGEPGRTLRWLMHPRCALVTAEVHPQLVWHGTVERDGRTVAVLAPRGLPFEHHALAFDTETGLLVRVGFHVDVDGWHAVDGVLRPGRVACSRKGGHTTWVFEETAAGPAPTD